MEIQFCKICNYSTNIPSNFYKHLKTQKHINNLSKNEIIIKKDEIIIKKDKKCDTTICDHCEKTVSLSNIARHLKTCKEKKANDVGFEKDKIIKEMDLQILEAHKNILLKDKEMDLQISEAHKNILLKENEIKKLKKEHNEIILNLKVELQMCQQTKNKSIVKKRNIERIIKNELIKHDDVYGLFTYNDNTLKTIIIDKNIWFKGSDVSKILKYEDVNKSINSKVDEEDKQTLKSLIGGRLTNLQKDIIYINEDGLYSLIIKKNNENSEGFKRWIERCVLPPVKQNGSYLTQELNEYNKLSFYGNNQMISKYYNKNVLYIGCIGIHNNEILFKFGVSNRIFERDYEEHRKLFDTFKLIYVVECDNNYNVESLFKKELKGRKLMRKYKFNGKNQKEVFAITQSYGYDNIKMILDSIIADNDLPQIKEYKREIEQMRMQLKLEKMKSSQ